MPSKDINEELKKCRSLEYFIENYCQIKDKNGEKFSIKLREQDRAFLKLVELAEKEGKQIIFKNRKFTII